MLKKALLGSIVVLIVAAALIVINGGVAGFRPPNPPAWENVFVPPVEGNEYTLVWAVESSGNKLYAAVANFYSGLQLYRSSDGKTWSAVGEPGLGVDPQYYVSYDMISFKGKLYVSMHDYGFHLVPGKIMRSGDGENWETVFTVNDEDFITDHQPAAFGEHNGMLYVASIGESTLGTPVGQLWRSRNGDAGTWEKVLSVEQGGFGGPLTSFKGYAYVSGVTGPDLSTVTVWRSRDGKTWETVGAGVLDGLGNYRDGTLAEYKGNLYLSTENWKGGCVYRSKDGKNWTQVAKDGFGDTTLKDLASLFVYKGDLYAFGIARDADDISYVKIYHSRSGEDWQQVSTGSWGANTGTERMQQAVFKGYLYLANFTLTNTSSVYKMVDR